MKAFLFAAGFGTRLAPLTQSLPKPLIPVKGLPLVLYGLALLREIGINEIVINLHYRGGMIEEYFTSRDNFGFTVHWSREEQILGTGGGVMAARGILEGEPFIVMNSDIITNVSLDGIVRRYHEAGETLLVLSPASACEATVSLAGDRVVDFRGVLESGIAPTCDYTGIGVIHPGIFQFLDTSFSSIVYTGYTSLASRGRCRGHIHDGLWLDTGTLAALRKAEAMLEGHPSITEGVRRNFGPCLDPNV